MPYAFQMSSPKRYTERPPANCRAARWAWDRLSKDGPILVLWLGEGYWTAQRDEDTYDSLDATVARRSYFEGFAA